MRNLLLLGVMFCSSGSGAVLIQKVLAASAAGTSFTVSFSNLPTAGNTVFVGVSTARGTSITHTGCSDNQGNTFTADVTRASPSGPVRASIYRLTNIGATAGTYTATCTLSASAIGTLTMAEYSGLLNVSPLDQIGSNGHNSLATIECGTSDPLTASELDIVVTADNYTGVSSFTPAGSIETIELSQTDGTNFTRALLGDAVPSSGTWIPTFTVNTAVASACVQAFYKLAVPAAARRRVLK